MTLHPNFIGCDIAKHWLDLYDPRARRWFKLANTPEALGAFAAQLDPASFVVMEATGHHDRLVRHALAGAAIPFARLNPLAARRFAQARGRLAKTDKIDARGLSELGAFLQPPPDPAPNPVREQRHLSEAFDQAVTADIQALAAHLTQRIRAIEQAIARLVEKELATQAERLQTAPGVGPVTATTLLAHMPELGHLSPKAAASLAGLAPHPNDSGNKRGLRPVKGGRPRLRRALYMAALSAIRSCPRFNTFFHALAQRSGSKKLAIIATARKLITALNAMMRDQTNFQ